MFDQKRKCLVKKNVLLLLIRETKLLFFSYNTIHNFLKGFSNFKIKNIKRCYSCVIKQIQKNTLTLVLIAVPGLTLLVVSLPLGWLPVLRLLHYHCSQSMASEVTCHSIGITARSPFTSLEVMSREWHVTCIFKL